MRTPKRVRFLFGILENFFILWQYKRPRSVRMTGVNQGVGFGK